jgi:hypothetical protein
MIGVDRELSLKDTQATVRERRASGAVQPPRFALHHVLLLAAIAALLVGVFWLSTASRSGLGFETGSHLRSLVRAHRVAESDGQIIQGSLSVILAASALPERPRLNQFLRIENGSPKPVTSVQGPRISRGPPPPAI